MSMRVLAVTAGLVGECVRVVDECPLFCSYGFTGPTAGSALRAALADERSVLVAAVREDLVAGFAWFVRRGAFDRSGYLRIIAVHPDMQRRGVGSCLLDWLEERHGAAAGVAVLVSEPNSVARAFYERRGYGLCGRLPDYVRAGAVECLYFRPGTRERGRP